MLKMAKQETRQDILRQRMAQSKEDVRQKSDLICSQIRKLPVFQEAETIMLYLPIRKEVDTMPLIRELWAAGKKVVIPVCQQEDISLIPGQIRSMDDLAPGTWGILEPKASCLMPVPAEEIDLVLVPGVAFDPQGNRLGYGAGYYDRFLPRLRPGVQKVAMAFEVQLVPGLETDCYDQIMYHVVTEEGIYTDRHFKPLEKPAESH